MNLIKKNEIFLLQEIVQRNFSSKYKDSVLGIFWSVLKPLSIMVMFTIIFSAVFSRDIENFPVYYLSAKCIFDLFVGAAGVAMNSIKGNKNILLQTAAPKYIFVLGGIISEFINFCITLLILVGVMIVTNAPFYFNALPFAIIPIISTVIMVSGFGLILSITCVYYTDIQHLWGVFTMILMYSSALFFPMSIVPQPFQYYMTLSPVYWVVNQFRCCVYEGVIPQWGYMLNSLLLSTIILLLGIIIFKIYEQNIAMRF